MASGLNRGREAEPLAPAALVGEDAGAGLAAEPRGVSTATAGANDCADAFSVERGDGAGPFETGAAAGAGAAEAGLLAAEAAAEGLATAGAEAAAGLLAGAETG